MNGSKRWPTSLFFALCLCGGLAHAQGMSPPAFADLDLNGDGVIDAEEFATHQAARMSERHGTQAGRGQGQGARPCPGGGPCNGPGNGPGKGPGMGQGQAYAPGAGKGSPGIPAYGDIDLDGDACISAEEFSRHVAARHGTTAED